MAASDGVVRMKGVASFASLAMVFAIAVNAAAPAAKPEVYPAPRFLKSLATPTPEALLEGARTATRNPYGLGGLGKVQSGWTVHIFLPYNQDMEVFKAIQTAFAERDVKAVGVMPWEVTGETKEQMSVRIRKQKALILGQEAFKELAVSDPVYYSYLTKAEQEEAGTPIGDLIVESGRYLDAHPEVEHIISQYGGAGLWWCQGAPRHCDKFVSNWVYVDPIDVTNHGADYPADVWNLVEDKIVQPVAYVSEGTLVDPQGTDMRWAVTPEQARKWSRYAKVPVANNHLFLFPNANDATTMEGVVAGCASHTGFLPCMKIHLSKHGRVDRVEGGGSTGEYFRSLLNNPAFSPKTVCFPGLPECGYWFMAADGYATNPKKSRNMERLIGGALDQPNVPERERAGVQHLGFGPPSGQFIFSREDVQAAIKEKRDMSVLLVDPKLVEYALDKKIPTGHTNHIHTYFPTIKWRLRDTGEWMTVSEKGRPTAFDDPEVRALAAKYGDVETIFSYDWIPAIPGINIPGDYQKDYAGNPWKWVVNEWKQIKAGTYPYLIPDYRMITSTVKEPKPQ